MEFTDPSSFNIYRLLKPEEDIIPAACLKRHTRFSIQREIKSITKMYAKDINNDLCEVLKPIIRQINKLEQYVSLKKQFLKNMYTLKLSIYMFEQKFLRFRDMYAYQIRDQKFAKTEETLLHVQWKLLYLERLVHN